MRTTSLPAGGRDAALDEIAVVYAGELDVATAPRVLAAIMECVRDEPDALVVNLAEVTFMDSSGAHMLVQAKAAADAHGVGFALRHPSEACRVVLEVTGLESGFSARD